MRFWSSFGRTELIIGASKAKYCEESYFLLRFGVALQNPMKNSEKLISETKTKPDLFLLSVEQ